MKQYVLDACALLALLQNEPGDDIVLSAFDAADAGAAMLTMNKLTLLEVYYKIFRTQGKERADRTISEVKERQLEINHEMSDELFNEAGRLKATHKISFADSIALAQASVLNAELLTSDHHEFDIVEKSEQIRFHWIR